MTRSLQAPRFGPDSHDQRVIGMPPRQNRTARLPTSGVGGLMQIEGGMPDNGSGGAAGGAPVHLPVEQDTSAEVDACFRAQRRIAVGYFMVFIAVTLAVPGLTFVLSWWSQARLIGGMSPNFAMAAFGIYAFFFIVALAASLLANNVEDGMLGGRDDADDDIGHLP